MQNSSINERALSDLKDIESEVNALMTIFLKREFNMREESVNSRYKKTAYMLYILFCNKHMFRYGPNKMNGVIKKYFNDYSQAQICKMHNTAKEAVFFDKVFKKLFETLESMAIKMTTEGWVKSREMQVQYIDRQILNLWSRKKLIMENRSN